MVDKVISAILVLVGLVNIAPVMAFFDIGRTQALYGLTVEGTDMSLLMRHRGVLLAIVGIALIIAAFRPEYRTLAIGLALVSKAAFFFLILTMPDHSAEIRRVALIDVGAVAALLAALALHFVYSK